MKVTPDDYGRRCQFDHFGAYHGDRNAGSFIGYIGLFIVPLVFKRSIIFDHTFAEKQ